MIYYIREKEIAKHGEIIKSRVRYLCTSKNKGQRVDYKGTTDRRSTTFSKNIKPDRTKDNTLKPKDDRASGWMTVTEAGYRELKRFGRRSQDGGSTTVQLRAIAPGKRRSKSRR